jgi:hypothetical protein
LIFASSSGPYKRSPADELVVAVLEVFAGFSKVADVDAVDDVVAY